jgi:hypothetical protein
LFIWLAGTDGNYPTESDQLRSGGYSTVGLVMALHPHNGWIPASADVAYFIDGSEYYLERAKLGSDADAYAVGEEVTVWYDLKHPNHMTINNEDNQPLWTVVPINIGLIASPVILGGGLLAWFRLRRRRRTLSRFPWRKDEGRELQVAGKRRYIELNGSTKIVRLGWLARSFSAVAGPVTTIRLCGESPRLVVAIGNLPTRVRAARPPRSLLQKEQWVRNAHQVANEDRPGTSRAFAE